MKLTTFRSRYEAEFGPFPVDNEESAEVWARWAADVPDRCIEELFATVSQERGKARYRPRLAEFRAAWTKIMERRNIQAKLPTIEQAVRRATEYDGMEIMLSPRAGAGDAIPWTIRAERDDDGCFVLLEPGIAWPCGHKDGSPVYLRKAVLLRDWLLYAQAHGTLDAAIDTLGKAIRQGKNEQKQMLTWEQFLRGVKPEELPSFLVEAGGEG